MTTTTTAETRQQKQSIHDLVFKCENRDQKLEVLKSLSQDAKAIVKLTEGEETVNSILIDWYTNDEHKEFHSFWDWKKLGYKVKKGEKAFFVWGRPKHNDRQEKPENSEGEEYKFYPISYLFSNAQVEPITKKED